MRNSKVIPGSLKLFGFLLLGSLMLLSFWSAPPGQLTILSGLKHATQYRFTEDIATIVGPSLDFNIINQETGGTAANFSKLADPKSPSKLAIVQLDYLYYMQSMDMRFKTEKTKDLKVVLPLGYEQIHLVTLASKGYKGLKDLERKTIGIGDEEHGTFRTGLLISERSNIKWDSKNTSLNNSLKELQLGKIDAFFVVNPAPVQELDLNPQSMTEKLTLVPLVDFNEWAKYYKADTIRQTDYRWLDNDVPTYSVAAVLVVNESKLSAEERNSIIELRAAMLKNDSLLKATGHPKWKEVNFSDWSEKDWPTYK